MSRCIFWPERKSSPWPYPPPWRGRCRGPGRPRPRSPGRWRCSTCWSCCWSSPAASATCSGCSHTATGTKGFEVRTVKYINSNWKIFDCWKNITHRYIYLEWRLHGCWLLGVGVLLVLGDGGEGGGVEHGPVLVQHQPPHHARHVPALLLILILHLL